MANKRMLGKDIALSEKVASLTVIQQLLYTWLTPFADDLGLIQHGYKTVKAMIMPLNDEITPKTIERDLKAIENVGLIKELRINNKLFWYIVNFSKYQTLKIDRKPQTIAEGIDNWDDFSKILNSIKEDEKTPEKEEAEKVLLEDIEEEVVVEIKPKKTTKGKKKKELSKEEKQLHTDCVDLIEYYKSKFKKGIGTEAIIVNYGRYIKQGKPYIKTLGIKKMKELCDVYFTTFDDDLIKKSNWNLSIFLSEYCINKLNFLYDQKWKN